MYPHYSAHPSLPYLASSGLEPVGKLWIPSGKRRSLAEYSKYSVEAEVMLDVTGWDVLRYDVIG